MNKLKMHTPNLTQDNIARIKEVFPGCVTEARGEDGKTKLAVDFDQLRQELSESIVEGPQERYHLNWPGKREALLTANAPIAKTLRPCREESVNFDTTQNLFIEGDNLDALKLLQESYLGKVKMIYIDPPYNTGNDFIYEDDFAENAEEFLRRSNQKDQEGNRLIANSDSKGRFHSDWLTMMYSRLKLAKNLLRDDGVIFISIDDGEQANLKKICDEIFGKDNFLANFLWKKKATTSNVKDAQVSSQVDYQFCYKKSLEAKLKQRVKSADQRSYPNQDGEGSYRTTVIEKKDSGSYKRDTMKFEILGRPPRDGKRWQIGKETAEELQKKNRFIWDGEKILLKIYDFEDGDTFSAQPNLLDNHGSSDTGARLVNNELFGVPELFNNPKPVELINYFVDIAVDKNDIILDFFAGSSTTAHAVMQVNARDGGSRKFIMVQLPEACDENTEAFAAGYKSIPEISKERIRRAGQKILESECHKNWNKDIGFRVLKVDSSNLADVYYAPDSTNQRDLLTLTDNVKSDRTPEDLLFQVLLDWGVYDGLTLPICQKKIQGKTVFFVNKPPYDLIACFDFDLSEDLIKELAGYKPVRVVFRDNGFVSDSVKINVEQIFKQLSPDTEVKAI
ncbi:MAG: adenine-specific DNA-methyltransferase [Clostridiales bacterium]|nr:adenine-specific DNA-methyltransferase [Clostridiales bacterium]MDN5281526.1 adenine-specific DNA-methyltransferase [Candidatus Ozemobacter sp.]